MTKKTKPKPKTTTTKRQDFWLDAAKEESTKGNDVAATLFWLIGQPSDKERKVKP